MSNPQLDKALREFSPTIEAGDPLSKALAELVAQVVVCKADERVARAMYARAAADRDTAVELVVRLLGEVHLARGHESRGRGVQSADGWRECKIEPCRRGRDTLAGIAEGRWPTGPAMAARIHVLEQELADERSQPPPDLTVTCAACKSASVTLGINLDAPNPVSIDLWPLNDWDFRPATGWYCPTCKVPL